MADRSDIDRVREATDLVELISEVTTVKRSGRSFMAVCPFHQEKTPSMSVDRGRGLYHCFGCGKGGDVFSFVQETQGVEFGDALELLATKAGITLTRDAADARDRGRRGAAVEAIRRAIDVYHRRLRSAPEAGPARAYLRSRGYDGDLIDDWKLGFAAVDWDTLTKELKAAGTDDRVLIDAGLSRKGRQGLFDVFRGRLMFPIYDLRGDPVGFGARKVEEIDRRVTNNPDAKYVNSADSVVYHKGSLLYGLDRARKAISDDAPAVIVEGYTDVIAMHQAGIATAIATCGTALGDGHFDLLRRFSERVVLAFDADEAGSKAALRGDELESPFRLDLDLRVAAMPDGLDPADLVQEGRGEELVAAVKEARPLLEHRIDHEVAKYDLTGPEGRARALHAATTQLRKVGDPIARREYGRFVARRIGVDLEAVESAVAGQSTIQPRSGASSERPFDRIDVELLRLILANDGGLGEVSTIDFSDDRLRSAYATIAPQVEVTPKGTPIDITGVEPLLQGVLLSLALDDRPLASVEEISARVRERRIDHQIAEVQAAMTRETPGSDSHSEYFQRLVALQREKRSPPER